jgi:hypothetical protein
MALPAHLLERLPMHFRHGEPQTSPAVLPFGLPELDSALPDGGLPRGAVAEFVVAGGAALATSAALLACKSAQREAVVRGGEAPFCAFIDPTSTLHGPGVAAAGVELDKLLVIRPSLDALSRTAIRVVESHAFSVVVVDTVGVPGASLDLALGNWPRVVRRLALAAEESGSSVILVTDADARRPLPLPVAMRIELSRSDVDRLTVRVSKDRRGRISGPRSIAWTRPRAKPLGVRKQRAHA